MDEEDALDLLEMPLGKGTCGLGAASDGAIWAYQRHAQEMWRRRKEQQKKDDRKEEERLAALVENEAKARRRGREEREQQRDRENVSYIERKEQEKELFLVIEKRREEWAATVQRDRADNLLKRQHFMREKALKKEREICARKAKREKERAQWTKEINDQEMLRRREVQNMKLRATVGRQMKQEAVEKAIRLKTDKAKLGKAEQRRKERTRCRRMQRNYELLKEDIKEAQDSQKKRRQEADDAKDKSMMLKRDQRRKETTAIYSAIQDRRAADLTAAIISHDREFEREQRTRSQRRENNYFQSSLLRGTSQYQQQQQLDRQSPAIGHPPRPMSAPVASSKTAAVLKLPPEERPTSAAK